MRKPTRRYLSAAHRVDAEAIQVQIDGIFENFLAWLAKVYDPSSGGFYYAISSKRNNLRFPEPDLESVSQAVSILEYCNLLVEMPESLREKLIRFFQCRQDSENGLFFDHFPEGFVSERTRGRALRLSLGALQALDARPCYLLPSQRGTLSEVIPHLRSLETFRKWLEERPWHSPWWALDHLWSQVELIKHLPQEQRSTLVELALDYVGALQDQRTGLWKGLHPFDEVSGAFKAALFYRAWGRTLPHAEKVYDASLRALREAECRDVCWLRNALELLTLLELQLGGTPRLHPLDIVLISLRCVDRFAQPDGGFSRHIGHAPPSSCGITLGMGLREGDMNAGVQMVCVIRPSLLHFAGVEAKPLPGAQEFWQIIRRCTG